MKKYILVLGVLAFAGCAFEPPCSSFEECVAEEGISPNNTNNSNNSNNSNNQVNNSNNANNQNSVNNANNANNINVNNLACPGPSNCGAAMANKDFDLNDFRGYGCRRLDDELTGTTQAHGDAVCDGRDQLMVYYSNCESTSYILEAVLIPEAGCEDELVLEVEDPVFDCDQSMLTRCETLADGNQRIQLLVRAGDFEESDVRFTVSSSTDGRGAYRLQTRVFR